MVVTDTLLVDTNIRVYVKAVSGNDNIISVSINKISSDKVLFQETIDRNSKLSYSDDDLALLQSNFTCDQSESILTTAGCTQSRRNKRKTLDCPSQSVYISLQPSPTSPHTEHRLRRLRGLSEDSDDGTLFVFVFVFADPLLIN